LRVDRINALLDCILPIIIWNYNRKEWMATILSLICDACVIVFMVCFFWGG
jgi:hypothetical protein